MNVIELMDSSISSYSKTDRAIYEAIRKFPQNFATQSVTELSNAAGFSKPALTRFAQRLGFGGFVEFQYQFAQDLEQARGRDDAPTNAEVYGELLKLVEERTDKEQLEALICRMEASRHVYVLGYNLSRIPAEELSIALRFNTNVYASYPQPDFPPHFCQDDLVIIYSAVGGHSYKDLMRELRSNPEDRPYLVLVTTNSKHPLRHNFDEVFALPTSTISTAGHTVLSDTFAFLMFNDLITSALADRGRGVEG